METPTENQPTETPSATVDLAKVREIVGIAADAPHEEFETALASIITIQQAQIEELKSAVAQADESAKSANDALANRVIQEFSPFITPESHDFWRENFLANRASTLATLEDLARLSTEVAAQPAPVATEIKTPLSNRAIAFPPAGGIPPAPAAITNRTADPVAVRNRANEIQKANPRLRYDEAFRQAEKELTPKE